MITLLDNNDIIYKLKLNKIKRIVIQQAYRYGSNILNFKKKIDKNSVDYLFVFNKSIGNVYRNELNAKINEIGSFLQNEIISIKIQKFYTNI